MSADKTSFFVICNEKTLWKMEILCYIINRNQSMGHSIYKMYGGIVCSTVISEKQD